MPWKESCAMDERTEFVLAHRRGLWTMTELCERYGVSRKTGYKWIGRYAAEGAAGLMERSRAPLVHGRATPVALAEAIMAMREQEPSWGARKIVARLALDQPQICWPSASVAGAILRRANLVTGRRLRRRAPPRLVGLTVPLRPNHVWGVDYKGWVRLGDGSRCEPLTVTDGFSRYLVGVAATTGTREEQARAVFERLFGRAGLPEAIRTDNGAPFVAAGVTGLTALSVWWIKLGIRHERIDPGRPQQNGRHERFHRTLLEAMRPRAADRAEQERRFAAFAQNYNERRPHEALGQRPPASLYTTSPRRLPAQLPAPVYPAAAALRQVRSNGEIKWQGRLVHIAGALYGETVALEETTTGEMLVRFYDAPLGVIDRKTMKLRCLDVHSPGGRDATPGQKT